VLDYRHIGALQRILLALGGKPGETQYADHVTLELLVPEEQTERFEAQVRDAFSAAVRPQALDVTELIIPE
jgi:putative IMPACT (imprinted ancient) family translation regulator